MQFKRPASQPAFFAGVASASHLNYFLGAIASFADFATRNFTTVLALI